MLTMLVSMEIPSGAQCEAVFRLIPFSLASMDPGALKGSLMCLDMATLLLSPCSLCPWKLGVVAACSFQVAPNRWQVLASLSLPEWILLGPEQGTICSLLPLCSEPKVIDWLQELLVALEKLLGREQPRNPSFS